MNAAAILPTRRAAILAAAGAPFAMLVAVALPTYWALGFAWPIAVVALVLGDAALAPRRGEAVLTAPATAPVGGTVDLAVAVRIAGATGWAEVAVSADPLLALPDDGRLPIRLVAGRGAGVLAVPTLRRGTARIATLWLRWRGPLGLAWHQRSRAVDVGIAILPDIRPVRERGAALFQRHALQGLIAQLDRGDGSEFETLVEYRAGMDRRAIDWKQSARHRKLHAKEYRPERNSQIVLAIDAGRQMADPVDGVPRADRAVSAALLLAWVALKLGDRVALEAFDEAPRLSTGFVGSASAFATLQHRAAAINYGTGESNYTYALTELGGRLTRRSLVVLFTEFTDVTAAGFLVRVAARLARGHLLLVVVLRDAELEGFVSHRPATPADVTRAVVAAGLLRDRALVLARLRHGGAHVIEARHDGVGDALVAAYVDLKRRGLA